MAHSRLWLDCIFQYCRAVCVRGGFAIHSSNEISQLGGPAFRGCIRLHPDNAASLYALVQQQGMEATTIVVSGEAPAGRRMPAESEYPATYPPAYGQPSYPPAYGQRPAPYYQQSPYQQPYYPPQPRGYYNGYRGRGTWRAAEAIHSS